MSFSTITMKQWRDKVQAELKGADPDSLYKQQLSGIVVKTVYTEADRPSDSTPLYRSDRGWTRRQRIANFNEAANKQILADRLVDLTISASFS